MRLAVKGSDGTVNEFRFATGPVYIGRHTHCQILLPDRKVSRQHAVIFSTQDGKWMVEDLNSANKTYLNNKQVHKAEIKTGDSLRITDFTIEVNLKDDSGVKRPMHLEDTLITTSREPQFIVRKPDVEHAPDIQLPAKRAKDFIQATEAICKANGPDEVLQVLLDILLTQFGAYRSWCSLRNEPAGPMTSSEAKGRDGQEIQQSDINLSAKITQAIEKSQFLLMPQVSRLTKDERIHSAMIAPIVGASGCFGVLYVDNDVEQEPYSLNDLDYLMLLAIHTAAILENF